jgi:hypothetical protein
MIDKLFICMISSRALVKGVILKLMTNHCRSLLFSSERSLFMGVVGTGICKDPNGEALVSLEHSNL